ncbi:MAG TPA: transporter [Sphingobium sp.]|uniref:transporter n=1 Tax=Sphingobium sp. TaxID=1912891 RepID=UPI002ED613B8
MIKKMVIYVLLLGAAPSTAYADPFVQAAGEGRIIITGLHTNSPTGFGDNGKVIDIPDYHQDQVYFQAEYGLTNNLTLLATPSYQGVDVNGTDKTSGLGYTDIGARYRIFHDDNWTVSLQGLVRIPGVKRADRAAQVGRTDAEYDMRAGVGYSFGSSFISLEGGYRLRAGDPPNEFHADFTIGTRLTSRLMLMVASYNTFSDGRGINVFNQVYRYDDVYPSLVYDITKHFSVQAGYFATFSGRNALRQRGPALGLWVKF